MVRGPKRSKKGLGIIGMEERTATVNGKVIVDSSRWFLCHHAPSNRYMSISRQQYEYSHVKRMNDCTYARSFFFFILEIEKRSEG